MIAVETSTATLETLAVTIQALHVNGKQMTLAVFRQLPIETEREGDDPWGVVRYSIKDEGGIWLVFSRDGKLYRHKLQLNAPRDARPLLADEICRIKSGKLRHVGRTPQESVANLERKIAQEDIDFPSILKRFKRDTELASLRQLFIAV